MHAIIILKVILLWTRLTLADEDDHIGTNKFGTQLVTELRSDANLDLSQDEEYEDLRAELLAYHTALSKLTDGNSRRSMMSTPCWQLGGICVNFKLCRGGFRFLTQVPGCRDKHNVCCFTWNKYHVKDLRDHNIGGPFPWSVQQLPFGGAGIQDADESVEEETKSRKKRKKKSKTKSNNIENEDDLDVVENSKVDEDIKGLRNKGNLKLKLIPNKSKGSKHIQKKRLVKEFSDEDLALQPIRKRRVKNIDASNDNTETLALLVREV